MTNQISKELPEQFTDKYFIYNGTDSIEEMNENLERLQLEKSKCYFIKLGGQFYAVFFESFEKEIIVGKDKVFFTQNGRLIESTVGEAKIGFQVNKRKVMFYTDTLAKELNLLYSPIEIYEYPTIKSKEVRISERQDLLLSNYVVILGVTFASRFYTLSDADKMEQYFVHTPELISFLRRTKGAISIDPFSQLVRFKDGNVGAYSYRRVSENHYYRNRSDSYYNGRNIGYKTVFALQEKNLYSPFRKREWISLTRYLSLYSEDNILYPQPDYREGKPICKWCGDSLPEGKKSYCSVDCRLSFGKAVNLERGALIPYLIMCRDKFICQTCDKDMAQVNEHGMKIPIPILHDKPDKDGVYRSEAEVDHLIAVKDGGSDHQSNLSTKCQDCHKEKHKSKKTKREKATIPSNVVSIETIRNKKYATTEKIPGPDLATEKQLSYLKFLAMKGGYQLYNTKTMERSEASKLIGYLLRNSSIDELVINKYLRRR